MSAISGAVGAGAILFIAAVVGKVAGNGLGALRLLGPGAGLMFGLGMVPWAEIEMVVMDEGRRLGSWAVDPSLYAAVSLVSLLTCLFSPMAIRWSLRKSSIPLNRN